MTEPSLAETDPDIHALVAREARRQADTLRLIPSENYASRAVLEASGSALNNKYSEGYPDKRYYQGHQNIDAMEKIAKARLALFNQCVHQLDVQKEILFGKGAGQGLPDLVRPGVKDKERQDLLRLALRLRAFDLMTDLSDENLFVIAKYIKQIFLE